VTELQHINFKSDSNPRPVNPIASVLPTTPQVMYVTCVGYEQFFCVFNFQLLCVLVMSICVLHGRMFIIYGILYMSYTCLCLYLYVCFSDVYMGCLFVCYMSLCLSVYM